jgi:hypothetical protein
MPADVTPDGEADRDILEASEQPLEGRRREELQVGGVLLWALADEEPNAVLEPERVRHRADETATGREDAAYLPDDPARIDEMLQQLPRDDHIERAVRKRQLVLDVGPDRRDAEPLGGDRECSAVDVDAGYVVARRIVLRQRAGAATEIEHPQARAADERPDERCALVAAENELLTPGVVRVVPRVQALKPRRHR